MRNLYLENNFSSLFSDIAHSEESVSLVYEDLMRRYAEKHRFYHTSGHIEFLLRTLDSFKHHLKNYRALSLAAWFHDAVYKVLAADNEKKSAELARKMLADFDFRSDELDLIEQLILSTEKHLPLNHSEDEKIFLDADLAVLGFPEAEYKKYSQNVRKEYQMIPDFLYKNGRKKVLENFLEKNSIYFTSFFTEKFENNARTNMENELKELL